ncbi:MAG: YbhB/YbcL family Raf kinase inhibitor-like protein [Thermodesulfobacteriota bacterium]
MNQWRLLWLGMVLLAVSTVHAQEFTLTSSDVSGQLTDNQVFSGFGCSGKNVSPHLQWQQVPKGAKSFAVTAYDPDAPTGSGWWHWIIFDIPKDTRQLVTGAGNLEKKLAPKTSIQSRTDFGPPGYGGACPPPGDKPHAYIFTVFALDVEKLGLDADASPALVGFTINRHAIAKASIIAYYSR